MNWFRDERGQVLALTIFSMTVLIGALGLAVDVGVLFHAKRTMQTAADAAAMAGATALYYYGANTTTVTAKVNAAAYAAAKANGVDNANTNNTVNVTIGVTLPGGTICSSCVEVALATPNPTIFMQTMSRLAFQGSSNYSTVSVSAMAVAGGPGASNNCMWVMDPTDADTLGIHGSGDINAPGCGVYVNSNNPAALCVTGSAGKSTLADIDVVGGQDSHGGCGGSPGTFPTNTTVPAQTPAIADLVPSNPAANCTTVTDLKSSGGTLTGSVNASGVEGTYYCYTDSTVGSHGAITPVTISSATLGPGIYVFETGVYITGTDTIGVGTGTGTSAQTSSGGGATIVVSGTSSQLNMDTASQVTIWAPNDTYQYNSIAVYQPLSDTQPMLLSFGSSTSIFMGTVYAPGSDVTLHDEGGGGVTATNLVVGEVYVNGVVNLSNYSTYNPNTTPFKYITLVE